MGGQGREMWVLAVYEVWQFGKGLLGGKCVFVWHGDQERMSAGRVWGKQCEQQAEENPSKKGLHEELAHEVRAIVENRTWEHFGKSKPSTQKIRQLLILSRVQRLMYNFSHPGRKRFKLPAPLSAPASVTPNTTVFMNHY